MLRDNLVGLIEPMPTARENDGSSLALSIHKQRQASDDRSSCLKNPRPAGAESSLTERTTSPFQTEPRQADSAYRNAVIENPVVLTGSCLTLAFLLLPWPKDEWRGIKPNPNQPSARITFHRFSNAPPRSRIDRDDSQALA